MHLKFEFVILINNLLGIKVTQSKFKVLWFKNKFLKCKYKKGVKNELWNNAIYGIDRFY